MTNEGSTSTRSHAALAAAIAAAALALITSLLGDGTRSGAPVTTTSRSPAPPHPPSHHGFSPPVLRDGEVVVMPIVFAENSRTQLVHIPRLRLAQLGVTIQHVAAGPGFVADVSEHCVTQFVLTYGDPHASFYRGDHATATYPGAGRPVEVWRGVDGSPYSLVFRLGGWTLVALCDLHPDAAARRTWIRALTGRVTATGFPILDPGGLRSFVAPGPGGGVSMQFGTWERGFNLSPGDCVPPHGEGVATTEGRRVRTAAREASWCLDRDLRIDARGSTRFLNDLVRGVTSRSTVLHVNEWVQFLPS